MTEREELIGISFDQFKQEFKFVAHADNNLTEDDIKNLYEAYCNDKLQREKPLTNNDWEYVEEAIYYMPYHELKDIKAFVRNHKWEDIPESIKEHLPEWEEFLVDNL